VAAEVSWALVRELEFFGAIFAGIQGFGRSFWDVSSELTARDVRKKGSGLQTAEYRLASDRSIGLRRG
jgi:hypothetical protein